MPYSGYPVVPAETERIEPGLAFGNVQNVQSYGLTLGFWHNKNGQKLITAADIAALNALYLRNPNGSDLVLSGNLNTAKRQLSDWLIDADASNMASMLSVQLATMVLNARHTDVTGVDGDSLLLVTYPDGTTRVVTVNALIAEADAALAANPLVLAGNPIRPYMESLKNALDDGNNNLNWVV